MLKSSLCDYDDAYIFVKGTIKIYSAGADDNAKRLDEWNKGVIFKKCAPFNDCISQINNTQIDNAKDLDVAMPIYSFIKYNDNYSKTSGNLWQYYRDEPSDILTNSESFRFRVKITGNTPAAGNTKDIKIAVPL